MNNEAVESARKKAAGVMALHREGGIFDQFGVRRKREQPQED
jgi:hypothetical protein